MKDCKNYQGMSVINAAYKTFSFILGEHLKPYINRPSKSTTLSKYISYDRYLNIKEMSYIMQWTMFASLRDSSYYVKSPLQIHKVSQVPKGKTT